MSSQAFDPVAEVFRQGGDFYDMLEAQRKERDMSKRKITCLNCGKGPRQNAGHGLCRTCHDKPEILARYSGTTLEPENLPVRFCEHPDCGNMYQPRSATQRYCSRRCQDAAGRARRKIQDSSRRDGCQHYRIGSWGLTRDPFDGGRFAMGLPGGHAMITPLEGMYSRPEPATEEAGVKEAA